MTGETHTKNYIDFDVTVTVSDDGDVAVKFSWGEDESVSMDWDTFREVIDFVGVHGMGMKQVWLNEIDADGAAT